MSLVRSIFAHLPISRFAVTDGTIFNQKAPASFYEPILKERMISFYDGTEYRELAKLKLHLEAEWGKLEKAGKAKEVKRKIAEEGEEGGGSIKKLKE